MNGGTLLFASTTGIPTVNVEKDVILNGGTLQPTAGSGVPVFNVKGNWTNNGGTFTPGSGLNTVTFNGTSLQTIGGSASTTFNNLTIANASGVSLGANQTVNGVLTFTNGKISTGANTLTLGPSGSVSGAGTGKYVFGNFQKPVTAGSPTLNFEVGGLSNYAPISVTFNSVNAGSLTASTTDGQHPNFADTDISSSDYINRYWTLTPSGLTFSSYDATFTFVNSADFVGSPTTGSLVLQKYSGSAWTDPVTTSSTSTSVTGTGFTSFSDFFTGNGGTPLPVTLSYFNATRSGTNVSFNWSTATETGNVGFNLYAQNGVQRIRLNKELIPSQATDSLSRLDYSFLAETSSDTFFIEDINVNGLSDLHGPFQLNEAYGDQIDQNKIDWDSIHAQSQAATAQSGGKFEFAGRPEMLSINLKVRQSGLFRITYEMLRDAGLDLSGMPANKLTLTNSGKTIPLYVAGADPFGPGGFIEFHGQALDTIYTDTNIYTLQVSPTPLNSLVEEEAAFNRLMIGKVTSYTETLEIQNQNEYANYAPGTDAWYDTSMLAFKSPKSWEFPFQIDGLASAAETTDLKLTVWGVTNWPQSPDHRLQVSVNGVLVATDAFDGLVERTIKLKLTAGLLHEGTNTLKLTLPADTGVDWDMINLDRFSVTYPRLLQARDGRLAFSAAGTSFTVTNLPSSEVVVYRLNEKNSISRLALVRVEDNGDGTFNATFNGSRASASYLVSTVDAMYAPAFEMARPKVDLNRPAQYLIIAHPDFINGLQPLIEAREAQGLKVSVVNVNDLYARYTHGIFDPLAIKQYIAHAVRNLGTQYVLLVGGDTYDYRNYLGVNSISFIPSLYVSTGPIANFVPVDPLFADVNNDNVPDVALGRFPVRTVTELDLIVAKTLSYSSKSYGQTAVFASDINDGGLSFKNINNSMTAQLPDGWTAGNIHLNDLSVTAARSELIAAMNRGTALVTYTGHSGPQEWTFSNLFNINHAASLTNHGKPFVVVQWGCWNNYHVDPVYNYLVQSFLFSGDQGAAAVLGASTLTDSTSEVLLGELLTPRLTQSGMPIGQALQSAKSELAQTHPELLDVLLGWSLMGDPALLILP